CWFMAEQENLAAVLQKTLRVGPEDLEANRAGKITDGQVGRVAGQMRSAWIGIGCFTVLPVIPLLVMMWIFTHPLFWILVGAILLVWLWRFIPRLRGIRKYYRDVELDLALGEAAAVEGFLQKDDRGEKEGGYFKVGDVELGVSKAIFE